MIAVTIAPSGLRLEARPGAVLGDLLSAAGLDLNLYCGRRGVCGKCFVEILAGDLPPADERERVLLASKKLDPGRFRLACRLLVAADLTVRIPETAMIPKTRILPTGPGRSVVLDPAVRKIAVRPSRPDLRIPQALVDGLKSSLGRPDLRIAPDTFYAAAAVLSGPPAGAGIVTAILADGDDLLGLEPGDTESRLYGVALDLGTTTLAADLVDLTSGSVVATAVGLNSQSSFGADVVSRISSAFQDPARAASLRSAALDSINALLDEIRRESGVAAGDIYETVIAGNTAMSHLFLGLSVDGLAVAPFAGVYSIAPPLPAGRSGLDVNPAGRVYLSPNLQSFVGGDISAGIVAAGLASRPGKVLFLDLGTNGELVLKTSRGLIAASTAAGPAFEGMSISCGMLARPGAVHKAFLGDDGEIHVETIGGGPARGVCGTGLIDLIASFLRRGDLARDGRIVSLAKKLPFGGGLALSAADIREIQLAAAAVKAGMQALLASEGLSAGDLDEVLVAGAFGAYLDIRNAGEIGLLPRISKGRIKFVGNTSLEGARALLLSRRERLEAERLSRRVRHLPLARDEAFQSVFIEALAFNPWPASPPEGEKEVL